MEDNGPVTNRRRYLKYASSAVIVGVAGCGGDGGETTTTTTTTTTTASLEPNHEVPHPSDDTLAESERTGTSLSGGDRQPGGQSAKDNPSVGLTHVPNGNQYCGKCSLYVPDGNDDGFGACVSVAGKIHPCDWCMLFTEYDGDTMPCEQG